MTGAGTGRTGGTGETGGAEAMSDAVAAATRCSRSVQTTIGWIFWDPGAVARYEALGLSSPIGYIAARSAPLAPAGPDAVIAAFGSISATAIRFTFSMVDQAGITFRDVWDARDEAVLEGLRAHAPAILEPLQAFGPRLWEIVDELPTLGRTFFASHLAIDRPTDPVLSGWHAVNCVREWRGDTHWALVVAAGLSGIEASILHNAWLGYEPGWLARSRGSTDDEIAAGMTTLASKGLVSNGVVNETGIALRQRLEDDTDRVGALPWALLGPQECVRFAEAFEPPCELLLARVDETAGPNYQPASRVRELR